jgi:hypothetical protein
MATLSASFETGDLSEFDTTVTDSGDLSAHADAAKNGTYGMRAVLDDATTIYGQFTFANKSELRLGFWFNPNGFDLVDTITIAGGGASIGSADYRIRLKYYATPQLVVFAGATNDAATYDYTSEVNISDDWHWIEVHMQRSSGPGNDDGFVKLWVDTVDETPDAELTGRDDDTQDFDFVNVGATSLTAPITETIYFDDIRANDTGTAIGPTSGAVTATANLYAVLNESQIVTPALHSYLADIAASSQAHLIMNGGGRVIMDGGGRVIIRGT